MLIKMSSFLSDFYPILYFFFEIFKFKTDKCEITPKFVSRTQPVTVNFPVNWIYRPNFFSLDPIRFRFRRGHQHRSTASRPPSPHFPLSAPIGRSMARRGFPVASPHRWAAQLLLDSARPRAQPQARQPPAAWSRT